MAIDGSSIMHSLSRPTPILGLKLWTAIVMFIILALLLLLIFVLLFIFCRFRRNKKRHVASKNHDNVYSNCSMDRRLLSQKNDRDIEMSIETPEKQVMYSDRCSSNGKINEVGTNNIVVDVECVASESRPVGWYSLMEIEAATNGLAYQNMIGSGEFGVVFHGLLKDNIRVAVKKLFSNRREKRDFVREAEALMLIRHRNLVKLLGYCAEGTCRMVVCEYADNGNLSQWLHHCASQVSPLTWNIRMRIIIGIAKGLIYLHEDTEPPLIHGHLKSSNILLDKQWNPKISNTGITKLSGPEWDHATSPPSGMSGYTAPEYKCIRTLGKKGDVYSFGMLIMEIVSGKTTIESTECGIEEYLVYWVKSMVAEQNFDAILDPKLPEFPTTKELKRILLIALRCVDFEVEKRPKMGEIIHMLEPRDLLLSDENVVKRHSFRCIL